MEISPVQSFSISLIFPEIAFGNAHALSFCGVFWEWIKMIDGAIRGGSVYSAEQVIRINLEALATFSKNPFWQEHKEALLPLAIQAAKAYADSLRWERSENFRDRATAEILRAQWQEVFWHVAKLCGGYDHMDQITRKYRQFKYSANGGDR